MTPLPAEDSENPLEVFNPAKSDNVAQLIPVSFLNVRVGVPLERIRQAVMDYLPNPIFEGETTLQAPLFGKEFDIIISYRGEILSFDMELKSNRLKIKPIVEFSVSVCLDAQGKTLNLFQLGDETERPSVELELTAEVEWGANGRLLFQNRQWTLSWLNQSKIAGSTLTVSDLIDVPFFKEKFEEFLDEMLLSDKYNEFSVNFLIEKHWTTISRPIELRENLWLSLNPDALGISTIHGEHGIFFTLVGVRCQPELSLSPPTQVTDRPFPESAPQSFGQGFHATLFGQIKFSEAEKLIYNELTERKITFRGFKLVVDDVRLLGNQNKIAIVLHVSSPIKGKIFLRGVPKYNAEKNLLCFEQLQYTLQTDSFLAKTADFMLHDRALDMLAERLSFDLGQKLSSSLSWLQNFSVQVSDDPPVELAGQTEKMKLLNIQLTSDAIRVFFRGEGNAQLVIS